MRIEYLTDDLPPVAAAPLRRGRAGYVRPLADGQFETEPRLQLSANSTHALIGHGVVDALNGLPLQGCLGNGRQVLVSPSQLDPARMLFYEADAMTYGQRHEFVLGRGFDDERVEYRICIDNREYQRTLSGLQYMFRTASVDGVAIWLKI